MKNLSLTFKLLHLSRRTDVKRKQILAALGVERELREAELNHVLGGFYTEYASDFKITEK